MQYNLKIHTKISNIVRLTCSVIVSREDVASSYISMRGSFRMARAIEILCFSPPGHHDQQLCISQYHTSHDLLRFIYLQTCVTNEWNGMKLSKKVA